MDSLRTKLASRYKEATGKPYLPTSEEGPTVDLGVRVIDFRPLEKGTMLGFSDFLVELAGVGLILRDCAVHERDGRQWVNLPSKAYTKKDGSKAYAPLFELNDSSVKAQFQAAAIEAVKSYEPGESE